MNYAPMPKTPVDQMKVRPHLTDGSQLTAVFPWGGLEKELGLEESTTYNLAFAAIERHLPARASKTRLPLLIKRLEEIAGISD